LWLLKSARITDEVKHIASSNHLTMSIEIQIFRNLWLVVRKGRANT